MALSQQINPCDTGDMGQARRNVQIYNGNNEEFEGSVVNNACWDQNILTDFQFVFCLNIFSTVFGLTTDLYDIVQSKQFDIAYCITKVQEMKNRIQELRNNFEPSWNSTLEVAEVPKRRGQTEQEVKKCHFNKYFSLLLTLQSCRLISGSKVLTAGNLFPC